jgi:hypothetical protein
MHTKKPIPHKYTHKFRIVSKIESAIAGWKELHEEAELIAGKMIVRYNNQS